jgi:uncharacterized protein (TIGR00251 family)
VIPRSGRPGPAGLREGAYLIRLSAPPIEGAANRELIELLSTLLHVPKRNIAIVSGGRSRTKRQRIDGVTDAEVAAALR